MALSRFTSCFHTVKNISRSKEKIDNTPADKAEQVNLDMKQGLGFQML